MNNTLVTSFHYIDYLAIVLFTFIMANPFFKKKLVLEDFIAVGFFFHVGLYTMIYLYANDQFHFLPLDYIYEVLLYLILCVLFFKFLCVTFINKEYRDVISTILIKSKKNIYINKIISAYIFSISIFILLTISIFSDFEWIKIFHQEYNIKVNPYVILIIKSLTIVFYTIFLYAVITSKKISIELISYTFAAFILAFNYGRRELLFLLVMLIIVLAYKERESIFNYVLNRYKTIFSLSLVFVLLSILFSEVRYQTRNLANPYNNQLSSVESTLVRNPQISTILIVAENKSQETKQYDGEFFIKSFINTIPSFIFDKPEFHSGIYIMDRIGISKLNQMATIDISRSDYLGFYIDFPLIIGSFLFALYNLTFFLLIFLSYKFFNTPFVQLYTVISISWIFFNVERDYVYTLYGSYKFLIGISIIFIGTRVYQAMNKQAQ
tara:strand:- start:4250 stop:5560 length:1311 start_codon:yes stop_codon:yes gene_type:complete